jgi:hypothetical protein
VKKTSTRALLTLAALVLFVIPVAVNAAAGFTDVADSNVFKADIEWMKDTGVTAGCNPPTNDKFCPGDPVTREQMSAFMHRLATRNIVDAATAQTAVAADDADLFDGKDSTAFAGSSHDHNAEYLAVKGKAADADLLDGLSSSSFLPNGTPPVGTTERGNYAIAGVDTASVDIAVDSIGWGFEMPTFPNEHFLTKGSAPTADCPGSPNDPQAAEGHLCVYEQQNSNVTGHLIRAGSNNAVNAADKYGAIISARNTAAGNFHSFGTWAITVGSP